MEKKHFGLQLSKAKAEARAGAYEPFFCALLVPEIRHLKAENWTLNINQITIQVLYYDLVLNSLSTIRE